ncbi:MAG: hypothetical protein KGV54_00665 [Oceanivirga sp.]|nr:hypothetical protein [Oceanivirga sp.]
MIGVVKIKTKKLSPKNSKKENLWVALSIVCLIILASILLKIRTHKENIDIENNSYIIAKNLNNSENIIYNNLEIVSQDIERILQVNPKPTLNYLKDELLYEPFLDFGIKNSTGNHTWYEFNDNNNIVLVGISKDKKIAGDFVFSIDLKKQKAKIKFTKDLKEFSSDINIKNLLVLVENIKEIKGYTGKDLIGDMEK